MRVSEADPRRLGVHAAISLPGVSEEVPPEYVPRDVDAAEHGVRARVAAAAERGGFVLLVGGSSVGKTRCAVEAVRALLPDWWLVHPAGPDQVAALAQAPVPRTVVWLDELQRYLDGEHGLTGAVVRTLLGAPHPAVIIGTLWPDRYNAYTAVPGPGGTDPHGREREVLDLAEITRIGPAFSPAEQDRARAAAASDPRLRVALGAAGYGLTQTLAAAPQLVARWDDAQAADPYAWAVLTAALDAARLGASAPLSADFLRAAAPGYCTSQQQAEAPGTWLEQALAYATEKLHGAAAALSPAGADMGHVVGYTVADYLIQHASRERRYDRVPASTWDAVLGYIRDPADNARLAYNAECRLLYRYAIPLYHHAADIGDRWAASRLVPLLTDRGDLDGAVQMLRAAADAGDWDPLFCWPIRLADRGELDGLRAAADAGDRNAAVRLIGLLADRGDLDELRARADAGDGPSAIGLARLLADRGDLDGLRARADADDWYAASRLAGLLADRGDLDGLRARADAGDGHAAGQLAGLLADRGDLDGLRARADAGDGHAAERLAGLLADRGDLDGPSRSCAPRPTPATARRRAAGRAAGRAAVTWTGEQCCAPRPTPATVRRRAAGRLLADRGDLDGAEQILRAGADAGDEPPPGGWPGCWPSAATWTGPSRSCAPGPTPATGRRPAAGRAAGRRAVTWTGCAPAPTPATGLPPGGWPGCWPSAVTWTGCAPGPTPATGPPPSGWPGCWPTAVTWTGCAPAPTPATGLPPGGWPGCWTSAATWTGWQILRAGPTPATSTPPRGWPSCWPTAVTWTGPSRSYAPAPMSATSMPPGGWPSCWPAAVTWTGLRARADAGDRPAAERLAELLADRGDLDGLRARADAGDEVPPGRWPTC